MENLSRGLIMGKLNCEEKVGEKMEWQQVWELIKNQEGWTTEEELHELFNAARQCDPRGVIVEIGCYKGRSTLALAYGSKSGLGITVHTIDIFTDFASPPVRRTGKIDGQKFKGDFLREAMKNIADHRMIDIVNIIQGLSEEVGKKWDKPISVLFIDGDHELESVRTDFNLFSPFVIKGGVIMLHDVGYFPGPYEVAKSAESDKLHFGNFKWLGNMVIFEKIR